MLRRGASLGRPRQWADEDILRVARECFLEQGPSVSTVVIAERLGMSHGALFKRFATKEELLIQALLPVQQHGWMERLSDGPDERSICDQLVEIATKLSEFFELLTPAIATLRSAGISMEDMGRRHNVPPPVVGHQAMSNWFRQAQQQGRLGSVDADALTMVFFGGLRARSFLRHITNNTYPASNGKNHAAVLVETLWAGMAPENER